MNDCNNLCKEYKANVQRGIGTLYNEKDIKRCSICDIMLKWEGVYCPCCSQVLRTKPRRRSNKALRLNVFEGY